MHKATHRLEKLLSLVRRGPEWRAKVLADPLAAAGEAGLDLSESERAVIASVPRATLERMIDIFEKREAPEPDEVAAWPEPEPEMAYSLGISPDIPNVPDDAELDPEDWLEVEITGIRPDEPEEK